MNLSLFCSDSYLCEKRREYKESYLGMEIINSFLNLVAPFFTFISLAFFLPPYVVLNYFLTFLRTLFSENVAGKVVLITGASSGIGEVT